MIVGISGVAGAGKDTVADLICSSKKGFVKVSLADPIKRVAAHVYEFSDAQLWGSSEQRNAPDARYPRTEAAARFVANGLHEQPNWMSLATKELGAYLPDSFLTPRYACQRIGTEFGRDCYPSTWTKYLLRVHQQLQDGGCYHDPKSGVRFALFANGPEIVAKTNVVVPDVRFRNEIDCILGAGGLVVRVKRPGAGLERSAGAHISEKEQETIQDWMFSAVIENIGTLADLKTKALACLDYLCRPSYDLDKLPSDQRPVF